MNKQQMIILIFSAFLLPFTVLSEGNSNEENNSKIVLEGSIKTGTLRSGGDAISVEIQGNMIMATFHRDLRNVQVTLTSDTGVTVYEGSVNSSVQTQAFIPLSELQPGEYTVTFSNNLGSMSGFFEI